MLPLPTLIRVCLLEAYPVVVHIILLLCKLCCLCLWMPQSIWIKHSKQECLLTSLVFNIPRHERQNADLSINVEHSCASHIQFSVTMHLNTGRLIENLFLLTLNKARGKDCEDVCVIHPSGSTSLSVTNTRHTAQRQVALSNVWHKSKGQIHHWTLSYIRKPSHVHLPCQKLIEWIIL